MALKRSHKSMIPLSPAQLCLEVCSLSAALGVWGNLIEKHYEPRHTFITFLLSWRSRLSKSTSSRHEWTAVCGLLLEGFRIESLRRVRANGNLLPLGS